MTTDDLRGEVRLHIDGAPAVAEIARAVDALRGLVEALGATKYDTAVCLTCDADDCDSTYPVDLTTGEQSIQDADRGGWARDGRGDYCPAHSPRTDS